MTSTGKETIREQLSTTTPDKKRFFHGFGHSKSEEEKLSKIESKISKLETKKAKEDDKLRKSAEEAEKKRFEKEEKERRKREEEETGAERKRFQRLEKEEKERRKQEEENNKLRKSAEEAERKKLEKEAKEKKKLEEEEEKSRKRQESEGKRRWKEDEDRRKKEESEREKEIKRSGSKSSQDSGSNSGFLNRFRHRNDDKNVIRTTSSSSGSIASNGTPQPPKSSEKDIASRQTSSSSLEEPLPIQSYSKEEEEERMMMSTVSGDSGARLSGEINSDDERPSSPVPESLYEGTIGEYQKMQNTVVLSNTEMRDSDIAPESPKAEFESCFMDTLMLPPILPGENGVQPDSDATIPSFAPIASEAFPAPNIPQQVGAIAANLKAAPARRLPQLPQGMKMPAMPNVRLPDMSQLPQMPQIPQMGVPMVVYGAQQLANASSIPGIPQPLSGAMALPNNLIDNMPVTPDQAWSVLKDDPHRPVHQSEQGDEEDYHHSKSTQHIGWCSWCTHYGPQNLMVRNRFGRNEYNCDDCCRNTIKCIKCKDGYAKRFSGRDEILCAVCDGTYESWETAKPPCIEGWCSWCFNLSQHALHKNSVIRKDIYQCQQCNRHTSPCKCKEAFAKARGESAEGQCAKCKKKIKDWNNREENLNLISREGWCSWCFEKTRHETEKDSMVKRSVFACRFCRLRTLKCYSCDTGMAKGGNVWDDHLCASCAIGKKVVWEDIKKKKDEILSRPRDINKVMEDLKRDSEYKSKALKAGCIRPFLIMVAMAPMFRFQIASCLGWTIFTEPYFGDAHAEAWHILDKHQFGMRFRTSTSYEKVNVFGLHSTWYDMLIRTADVGFSYQLPAKLVKGSRKQRKCQDSNDTFIPKIEEEFLSMLAHLMRSQMSNKEREEQARSALGDSALIIQRKIFENSGITRKDVGQYGYDVTNKIQKALGIQNQIKTAFMQQASGALSNVSSALSAFSQTTGVAGSAGATTATTVLPQILSSTVPQLTGVIGSVAGLSAVVTAQMALLSTPLFFLGFLGLAKTGFNMIFGSSEGRLFVPVTIILNQRILLAIEGIRIEDYY